jgi:hypothetical protein
MGYKYGRKGYDSATGTMEKRAIRRREKRGKPKKRLRRNGSRWRKRKKISDSVKREMGRSKALKLQPLKRSYVSTRLQDATNSYVCILRSYHRGSLKYHEVRI